MEPSMNTSVVHAVPQTIGMRNLSATNSSPESRPSSPDARIISSAVWRARAKPGRDTRRDRLGANGSSRRKTSGRLRAVLRPSASVTYVISCATDAAYAAKPAAHAAQQMITAVCSKVMADDVLCVSFYHNAPPP